ncbi:orotate phosphoribosyltransferase [Bacteroidia bacterium]|nr:orotate phosphoribosyltransferase [Bacteroidia bacterium]
MSESISQKVSQSLLQIKAVKLNNETPFTWASGRKSPIYCDNRVTLSHPEVRTFIRDQFVSLIRQQYSQVEVIAGVATGGIAQGALVAQVLEKPFVYVRAEEKKHGMHNRIEGKIESGQQVVVIEDLISTGKSSLLAVDALRDINCNVLGMAAIFTYELQVATDNFLNAKVPLDTLTNYSVLVDEAQQAGYVTPQDLDSLKTWRLNPEKWSDDRLNA